MDFENRNEKEKKFDAVKFMRQQRDKVTQIITGMTAEQELEYFKKIRGI